jgi:hypothetical protein
LAPRYAQGLGKERLKSSGMLTGDFAHSPG